MMYQQLRRVMRTISYEGWRALKVVIAVAIGMGIAIAIVAAGEGVDKKINSLLNAGSSVDLQTVGIDLEEIRRVLTQVRALLLLLSTAYTVASVAMVTWASMPQRRREVSIARTEGQRRSAIMTELGMEALILCGTGGVLGLCLGYYLCGLITLWKPSIPMELSFGGIATVFSSTLGATFGVTMLLAFLLATSFRDPER